jgi:hypothetical protein
MCSPGVPTNTSPEGLEVIVQVIVFGVNLIRVAPNTSNSSASGSPRSPSFYLSSPTSALQPASHSQAAYESPTANQLYHTHHTPSFLYNQLLQPHKPAHSPLCFIRTSISACPYSLFLLPSFLHLPYHKGRYATAKRPPPRSSRHFSSKPLHTLCHTLPTWYSTTIAQLPPTSPSQHSN